jgi:diguanylate cyclase
MNGNGRLSIVIVDVDHFKDLNDTYGHTRGNVVLKGLGRTLKISSRQETILCRYGGDEFIIILKSATQQEAASYADRIRKDIHASLLNGESNLDVTVSCGVCGLNESGARTPEQLLEFADIALYHAKQNGRNQTHIYTKEDKPQADYQPKEL